MSRVHDALRKVTQESSENTRDTVREPARAPVSRAAPPPSPPPVPEDNWGVPARSAGASVLVETAEPDLREIIQNAKEIMFSPSSDSLLMNPHKPREAPAEEFRSLRTRLNHLQTLQPLHTLVVTSASPAEGKSFTAANLAIAQSQLADKRVLLADFDFRRPSVDKAFQIDCSPGITDYLTGKSSLSSMMRRVAGTNLYILTAGDAVPNPLELLNLKECKALIDDLRDQFDWVILDSPPLLFAADGNLLATMCDGTILVVRIGGTTFDAVTRAMQSLCENNVLGVVVNGARRGELYSKYTYYHDYYTPTAEDKQLPDVTVPVLESGDATIENRR